MTKSLKYSESTIVEQTMNLNKFPILIGLNNFSRIIRDTRKTVSNLTKNLKRNLFRKTSKKGCKKKHESQMQMYLILIETRFLLSSKELYIWKKILLLDKGKRK